MTPRCLSILPFPCTRLPGNAVQRIQPAADPGVDMPCCDKPRQAAAVNRIDQPSPLIKQRALFALPGLLFGQADNLGPAFNSASALLTLSWLLMAIRSAFLAMH